MALARARRDGGMNYWPGFVDVLSSFILGIIFLLTVFVFVQFYLTQEVTGKDTALNRLNAQIAQLTELLSLEKTGKLGLEEQLSMLRSSLTAAEGERDRYKGLYDGVGGGAQGKAAELSGQLDAERRLSSGRWRRSRCSTSRSPRCDASSPRSKRPSMQARNGIRNHRAASPIWANG